MQQLDGGEEEFFQLAGLQGWQQPKRRDLRARSAGALRTSAAIKDLFDAALRSQTEAALFQTALAGAESQQFYRPRAWPRRLRAASRTEVRPDAEAQVWASRQPRIQKMHALVRCLPNCRARDALLTACASGDEVLYRALRERFSSDGFLMCCEDMTRKTPLHLAAQHGHLEICKDLIESQADVNASDNFGCSPIYLACKHAKAPIVQFLLQNKALPEQEDRSQRSAFHLSCLCSDPKIAWSLLQVHPKLASLVDGYGRTGLHYALLNTHRRQGTGSLSWRVLKLLLESNAEANALDCYSRSPLWYAAERGMAHSVAMLLDHRANPDIRDCDGRELLDAVRGAAATAQLAGGLGAEDVAHMEASIQHFELIDHAKELEQAHAAIAKRELLIQELEAKLQEGAVEEEPLADVTGIWLFDGGHSIVTMNQDPGNGNVSGEFATPGKRALDFHGKVIAGQLVFELGAPGRTTKFILDLQQDGSKLSGTWMDYRGGSGPQELYRQVVNSEES